VFCDEFSERGTDLVDSHNSNPDTTGSYTGGFLVLIGVAALSAVAFVGLPKGRKPA